MKRSRREAMRVCFDEQADTIIPTSSLLQEEEHQGQQPSQQQQQHVLWYSPAEIAHFKRQNEQLRATLVRIDKVSFRNPTSWSSALRRLHGACCRWATAEKVVQVLERTPALPFQDICLGLERQGIPAIATAVLRRRAEIYAAIFELQYTHDNLSVEAKWQRMCQASRTVSRASALYARLLAEIVAATITQRMRVDLTVADAVVVNEQQGKDVAVEAQEEEQEEEEDDFTPLPF